LPYSSLLWYSLLQTDREYPLKGGLVSTQKEKLLIRKNVRLPSKIYDDLVAEANKTGISQPAVMVRAIIVERLQKGDLERLAFFASERKPHILMNDPRINIHLTEEISEKVNVAAGVVSRGKFSGLIQAILIERYEKD
jgi:hypothetical protein